MNPMSSRHRRKSVFLFVSFRDAGSLSGSRVNPGTVCLHVTWLIFPGWLPPGLRAGTCNHPLNLPFLGDRKPHLDPESGTACPGPPVSPHACQDRWGVFWFSSMFSSRSPQSVCVYNICISPSTLGLKPWVLCPSRCHLNPAPKVTSGHEALTVHF